MNKINVLIICIIALLCSHVSFSQINKKTGSWEMLMQESQKIGKPEWHPMLKYLADLHKKSMHKAQFPFVFDWEEIGPGYTYGLAFGHWDIVHQVLDVLPSFSEHAIHQLLNNIANQEPTGLLPGSIWMPGSKSAKNGKATWNTSSEGHPPVWVYAVNEYVKLTGDSLVLKKFYLPLVRQISWFENERRAEGEGFFYNDIITGNWESGIDQGVRFDKALKGRFACIDATSHVYQLYKVLTVWSKSLGFPNEWCNKRENELLKFIQDSLYASDDQNFYDFWAVKDKSFRHITFESMWPLVVGAATPIQANHFIDKYLLDTSCFLTPHPMATIGKRDPAFSFRMWRGASWNSMTYWAAIACLNYGRKDAARLLIEKALDNTALQFDRTGTIWEFYHPLGGKQEDVQRKPKKQPNLPCKDYLGHNPLMAMARLYDQIVK